MKKKLLQTAVFGIVVLLTVAIFTMTACGEAPDGGGIPVKMRAYNNGIAPANLSMSRAVGGGLVRAPRAVDSSFDTYASFYSKLGAKKSDIKPSKFVLNATQISLISAGWEGDIDLAEGGKDFDFAQGQTFTLSDVPEDTICSAMSFRFTVGKVEFEWPSDINIEDFAAQYATYFVEELDDISWNGNYLTISGFRLAASFVNNYYESAFDVPSGVDVGDVNHIFYGGSGDIRLNYKNSLWADEVVPGFPHSDISAGEGNQTNTDADIVVPFEPINVPSGSSSVTFNISWNLDGMIERYEGPTNESDDDIFILKKGWWEGLQMTASVQ